MRRGACACPLKKKNLIKVRKFTGVHHSMMRGG